MTNATKTLGLLFAGTIALAVITSWSWSGSSTAAFQGQLIELDTNAVQAVTIDRSQASPIRLERSSSGWSIVPPDTSASYPANTRSINQLLSTLPTLQISAVATRQSDKHPRYGVDSTGTRITMLGADNEPIGELIVGRTRIRRPEPQNQGQSRMQRRRRRRQGTPITYVRPPDRPDVYSIERSLRSLTTRSIEDWRDKRIWSINRANIQQVNFTLPGDSSFTMRRTAASDTASANGPSTWISGGDTLSGTEVSSVLRILSSPEADGFEEGTSPDELDAPRYEVQVRLNDGSRRTLRIYPATSGAYLATADGFSSVARLKKGRWDRSVLLGRPPLLKDN